MTCHSFGRIKVGKNQFQHGKLHNLLYTIDTDLQSVLYLTASNTSLHLCFPSYCTLLKRLSKELTYRIGTCLHTYIVENIDNGRQNLPANINVVQLLFQKN